MSEEYLMKCPFGRHAGKFLYKHPANNGTPVWATCFVSARRFETKEEFYLYTVEKNIPCYQMVIVTIHSKDT